MGDERVVVDGKREEGRAGDGEGGYVRDCAASTGSGAAPFDALNVETEFSCRTHEEPTPSSPQHCEANTLLLLTVR